MRPPFRRIDSRSARHAAAMLRVDSAADYSVICCPLTSLINTVHADSLVHQFHRENFSFLNFLFTHHQYTILNTIALDYVKQQVASDHRDFITSSLSLTIT